MKKSILLLLFIASHFITQAAEEIPIATEPYSQTSAIATHNGEQFFAGYIDRRGGTSYEFYGRFISNQGEVSASDYQLVPSHNAMSIMNDLAYGDNQFIFSWSRQRGPWDYQRDAYTRLINNDGTPFGNAFRVSTHNTLAANFLKSAFDGEKYLVIWQQGAPTQSSTIMGQFISPEGGTIGNNFAIRPESLGDNDSQIYPDILFDGENYLVVWDDNRSGSRRVYGWFLDTDGEPSGDDFPISESATTDQYLVQAAFNGTYYMAAWADRRDGSKNGVYGQIFNAQGEMMGENLGISVLAENEERSWPRIGSNGNQFLVAWERQTLNKGLVQTSGERLIISEAAGVESGKSTIWYEVHGRLINPNGTFAGDEFPIGVNAFHQQSPSIASDGEKFLTVWQDSRNNNQYNDIYGLFTEAAETPVLNPPQNLQAEFETDKVLLTWEPPADEKEFLYYNLYRNDVLLASDVSEEEFTDEDIEQLLSYTWYITAVYQDGESEPSNSVEITIPQMYVSIAFYIFEAHPALEPIPLEGVKVMLESAGEALTNEEGMAMFEDVPVAESLSYTAEKEGFFPKSGTIEDVHQDTQVELFMEPDDTFIHQPVQYNTLIWPLPARDILNLRSNYTIEEVSIFNLTGKVVVSQAGHQNKVMKLTIDHLHPGVYIMKVRLGNQTKQVHKIVIQ
ncbi:MAG: T9SS C-terminal target domain-containing protein [Bacteroidetes bacterium]|nr:MAG: T9SS C-terminal target domain-containing protein [Bacteroidota bacterium]